MAAQQKKSGQNSGRTAGKNTGKNTGRGSGGSAGKSAGGSSGRSGSRSAGGNRTSGSRKRSSRQDDRLTNILFGLLLVAVVVLVVAFAFKKRGSGEEETPTPTPAIQGNTPAPTPTEQAGENITPEPTPTEPAAPTGEGEPGGSTPEPVPTDTPAGELTPALSPTPEPTPTPSKVPPTPEAEVSLEEAEKLIENAFWEAGEGYRFELSDNDMELGGATYYRYRVYYRNKVQDYALLVDRVSGKLYYYENGERTDFDGGRHEPDEDGAMTEEKAAELLADIPHASLMLPAPLGECRLSLDRWRTVVSGVDCYCLNVFYQDALAGSIYFTETADTVYYLDEFGEFVRVR